MEIYLKITIGPSDHGLPVSEDAYDVNGIPEALFSYVTDATCNQLVDVHTVVDAVVNAMHVHSYAENDLWRVTSVVAVNERGEEL